MTSAPGDASRLRRLVDAFGALRVAVVGDIIADEFIYGRLSRISREAPVLILNYDSTTVVPGGAGNAARNVAALGGVAQLVGLVGRGAVDRRLARSLGARVDRTRLLRPAGYRAPVKTRILAGGLHSARQQIVRVDREATPVAEVGVRREFERAAVRAAAECDAVLVSDYGSGLVSPTIVPKLARAVSRRGKPSAPILVDSRYNLFAFRGYTACTPNESEVEQMLGAPIGDDPGRLERAGRAVLRRTRAQGVVVTRGSRGMAVFAPGRRTARIPIFGTDEVADVTGAGDTVIATMTLALASGASLLDAAHLANYAGGVVVMKRGTATVSGGELAAAVHAANDTGWMRAPAE